MHGAAELERNFDSVLERLRSESLQHFAAAKVTMVPHRFVVRPFSQVMEVDIDAGGRVISAFVKILKPRADGVQALEATRRNIAREFEVTTKVHGRFAPHAGLSTARPIACYPELLAMVTERVDGISLQRLLSRARGFPSARTLQSLCSTMRRVGAWLRTFQALDSSEGHVSLDQLRTYLDQRLQPLADGRVIGADVRVRVLRYFDDLAGEVPRSDLEAVPVHADFTPENVIIRDFVNLYGCDIGDETKIGAFVEIQRGVVIGARCKISSHSFVCEGVRIEDEVFVGHGVTFTNDAVRASLEQSHAQL